MSQRADVGSVSRLWRYPVKSMLGEEADSFDVVWSGVYGNRCYALVDKESSNLVSAKNPLKWARMFECSARVLKEDPLPLPGTVGLPRVRITLPGGEHFDVAAGDFGGAEAALTRLFGRGVSFVAARSEPGEATYEQYYPEIEEEPRRGKVAEKVRPISYQAGTFADKAAVHLVTTSSLRAMAQTSPAAGFDVARFRPNFLVETGDAPGFVETGWVGKRLAVGEVELDVFAECGRCVMTTLRQQALPSDTGVLSAVMRHNRGKLGVFASVVTGGKVRNGDKVALVQ